MDDALRGGADLTFDSYPYVRGSTTLAMVTLPDWLPAADFAATLDALTDPGTARRLDDEWSAGRGELWDRITLSHVPADELRWAEGLRLSEAARRVGLDPPVFCRELLVATRLETGCVFGHRAVPSSAAAARAEKEGHTKVAAHPEMVAEQSMRALLRHPAQLAGSDGIYLGGHPHPRGWGAFARLLGRHVRELGDWTWEQAAMHMAGHTARRFGLRDRGLIRRGQAADIVVLDPDTVGDRATYASPREPAVGVEHVFVNGIQVLSGGALIRAPRGMRPGRVLRPG
jgi:N-acyl-D-amino-acid deacylase